MEDDAAVKALKGEVLYRRWVSARRKGARKRKEEKDFLGGEGGGG